MARTPTRSTGGTPETQLYDVFQRRVEARDPLASSVEPYYKDEISMGFDWQFLNNWVFKSRVTSWEMENMFHSTLQFDEQGAVVRDLRNWPQNRRQYEGILFQLNRAFRDGWSLQMNYARDWNEGNNESRNDNDDHLEGFGRHRGFDRDSQSHQWPQLVRVRSATSGTTSSTSSA